MGYIPGNFEYGRPRKQIVIELKIWRGNAYHERGERQLMDYMEHYHLKKGYMLSFNFNKNKRILECGVLCLGLRCWWRRWCRSKPLNLCHLLFEFLIWRYRIIPNMAAISSVVIVTFDFSIRIFPPVIMYDGITLIPL